MYFLPAGKPVELYANHLSQIELQLAREPRPLPQLRLSTGVREIFDFTFDYFSIQGYDPHPAILGSMSVSLIAAVAANRVNGAYKSREWN